MLDTNFSPSRVPTRHCLVINFYSPIFTLVIIKRYCDNTTCIVIRLAVIFTGYPVPKPNRQFSFSQIVSYNLLVNEFLPKRFPLSFYWFLGESSSTKETRPLCQRVLGLPPIGFKIKRDWDLKLTFSSLIRTKEFFGRTEACKSKSLSMLIVGI